MTEYIEALQHLAEQFGRLQGVGRKTAMRMAFSVIELDAEAAQEFAAKHVMAIRMAASKSYLIRTACMVATLLVGLFVGIFNAVATVVPLLAYRPILYISEFVRKKKEAKG
jgi:hypothetical protein